MIDNVQDAMNALNLTVKLQDKAPLSWLDVPEIIPLRWIYLVENWKDIKNILEYRVNQITDTDTGLQTRLRQQIDRMNNLINLRPN